MKTICLVEDEADLREILTLYLEKNHWQVICCATLSEAWAITSETVDLWVIDIMLPDGSGFEILKEVKHQNVTTPVILISARGESVDRVVGFELGCDDYIAKPFLPVELIFRIKKLAQTAEKSDAKERISLGPYIMDKQRRVIFDREEIVSMTSREFEIVQFFLEHPAIAIPRDMLLDQIWGEDYFGSDRVVDNYIRRIRQKLPDFPIETIYGFGYRCNL